MKSRLQQQRGSCARLFVKNDEAQTVTAKCIYQQAGSFFMNILKAVGLKDSREGLKLPRQLK